MLPAAQSEGRHADSLGNAARARSAPSTLAIRAAVTCAFDRMSDTDARLCARSARRPSSRRNLPPRFDPRQTTIVSAIRITNSRSAAALNSTPAINSGITNAASPLAFLASIGDIKCLVLQVSEARRGQVVAGFSYPFQGEGIRLNTYRDFDRASRPALGASIPAPVIGVHSTLRMNLIGEGA